MKKMFFLIFLLLSLPLYANEMICEKTECETHNLLNHTFSFSMNLDFFPKGGARSAEVRPSYFENGQKYWIGHSLGALIKLTYGFAPDSSD
ncbi:MAG: hypothetical protein HYV97_05050 [Bdellovibrio sp.]|nr:hypothetical protein [Bdellovibrio sp.]